MAVKLMVAGVVLLVFFHGFGKEIFALENLPKFAQQKAVTTPAKDILKEAKAYLPKRGLLFVSGGLMSAGSRLVIDLDKKELVYGRNDGKNSSPYGKLTEAGKFSLTVYELANVITLANKVWSSQESFSHFPNIIADYDVILILADQGSYREVKSYGPAMGKVKELSDYVWKLVEDNNKKAQNAKRELAIKLASEAVAKRMAPNSQRILIKVEPVEGHPNLWDVDFGIPNVADSNVLITVDLNKQIVIDFKVMGPGS